MHVVFEHSDRAVKLTDNVSRYAFSMGCEAVINDMITETYKFQLPLIMIDGKECEPVNGKKLIGRSAAEMSADQVASLLKNKWFDEGSKNEDKDPNANWDDICITSPENKEVSVELGESPELVEKLKEAIETGLFRDAYSQTSFGKAKKRKWKRLVTQSINLAKYLIDNVRVSAILETDWAKVNRKTFAFYPGVIVPTIDNKQDDFFVLYAVDTSGSISSKFLSTAMSVATQRLAGVKQDIIAWDTEVFPVKEVGMHLVGGSRGTDPRCIEKHIQEKYGKMHYPDKIFVITDGCFAKGLEVNNPENWVWILPKAYGYDDAIPKKSKIEKILIIGENKR